MTKRYDSNRTAAARSESIHRRQIRRDMAFYGSRIG